MLAFRRHIALKRCAETRDAASALFFVKDVSQYANFHTADVHDAETLTIQSVS